MSEATARPSPYHLVDAPGPSAFMRDPKRFWSLLWLSSRMEFKVRYSDQVLGYAWALLQPLALFGVLYLVFTHVFGFGDTIPYYAALLVFGIVLFSFFTDAVGAAVPSVVGAESVVRKTQFPRAVVPLGVVMTSLMTLAFNLGAISVFIYLSDTEPRWSWLLVPFMIALLIVFTACTAMWLSALYTRYRDIGQAWTVVSRVLFYATPILFPIELVSNPLRQIFIANPLAPIFIESRRAIFDPAAMSTLEAANGPIPILISVTLFVTICFFGVRYFVRLAPRIAEDL